MIHYLDENEPTAIDRIESLAAWRRGERMEIDEATRAVVRANGLSQAYIRPIAWRGSEVLGVSAIGTTVSAPPTTSWPG